MDLGQPGGSGGHSPQAGGTSASYIPPPKKKKKSSGGGGGLGTGQDRRTKRRGSSSGSSGRRSSSGGGGGSFSSGGGGGGAPKVPGVKGYLAGDASYQQAVRGQKRSLADFLSEIGRRRGEATTQFTQTKSSMERDRVTQLEDLRNEFASRGLIQSGLYGEEQGKFQQKFTEQMSALEQQQAALLADLLSQQKNYQREQDLALELARQEALQRRSEKFNIGG